MTTAVELARLRAHAVEFGYLYDPHSGEPLRNHGRHLVRTTRDFPQGVLPVALPARLAGHVSALPYLIEPEHDDTGALLILPSYARTSPGVLQEAWVTIQRLRLNPLTDAPHLPGDAVRSSSLIFDWCDYSVHSPFLHRAIASLSTDPVSVREPDASRLDRPRTPVMLSDPGRRTAEVDTAARAIAGAVMRGATLRLDSRWCSTEADFIEAFLGALGRIPSAMRGHVSAASGLSSADRGFQIVWCLDGLGLAPDCPTARHLIQIGAVEGWGHNAPDSPIADDPQFNADHGLVSPTFDAPDLHAHVRRHIRKRFEGLTGSHGAAAAPDVRLACYVAGGDLSPVEADQLLLELAHPAAAGGRMRTGVSAVLTGIASTTCTVEEIGTALDLCELADTAEGDIRVSRVHRLAGQLISARLAETVVVPEELLSMATQQGLARIVAKEFANGNQRAIEPLRRALAGLAKRDRAAFRRIAGRVLPRDHRVLSVWNGGHAEDFCLAGALFDAVATPRRVDADSMASVSETLVAEGKWDLVREALLAAANGIARGQQGAVPDSEAVASRLRLVSAIALSMERRLPSPSRTAAA